MIFVVWANDFNENSGGNIVLHRLASMLQQQGHEVYLANKNTIDMPSSGWSGVTARTVFLVRYLNHMVRAWQKGRSRPTLVAPFRQQVKTHRSMTIPTFPGLSGRPFVAIYPQSTPGNPLRADFVVRWLLHQPGYKRKTKPLPFPSEELIFFYQHGFVTDWSGIDPSNLLQVRWLRNDIYRDEGLPDRHGVCRMVRKGRGTFHPEMAASDRYPVLDHLPHAEIAAVFNRCEVFISHDPYTMYLYYAALCGCTPVVIPQPGLDATTWREGFELKQGVAYGMEDLEFARATREGLMQDMAKAQVGEEAMVLSFVEKVRDRFLS